MDWKTKRFDALAFGLGVLCVIGPLSAHAQTMQSSEAQLKAINAGSAEPELDEATDPSLQFLEFLGQWETSDGKWLSPTELVDESFGQLLDMLNKQDEDGSQSP